MDTNQKSDEAKLSEEQAVDIMCKAAWPKGFGFGKQACMMDAYRALLPHLAPDKGLVEAAQAMQTMMVKMYNAYGQEDKEMLRCINKMAAALAKGGM